MSDTRPVILIDLGSIYWACWHSTANEAVSEAHDRTIAAIQKLASGYDLVAVCCDSPRNFRKELDPAYKANRPPRDSAAYVELARTKASLETRGFLLWEADGYEADDILAGACRSAVKAGHDVVIASSDKDLAQLVQFGVTWLSPKTGESRDRDGVRAKFGVWPEQMRDYLAIVGDSTDNVRGVRGVGPKIAAKLLGDFVTIEQLMSAVVHAPRTVGTPAVVAALTEAIEWLPLTVKLVSLKYDAPIEWGEIYETRKLENPVHDQIIEANDAGDLDFEDQSFKTERPAANDHEVSRAAEVEAAGNDGAAIEVAQAQLLVAPNWEMGLEPTSLGAAFKLARGLYDSGLYAKFKNPAAIWAVIIRGRELGLGALTALDCFNVVEGKPCPGAHFLIARAKRHPDCEYLEFVQGNGNAAVWRGKARGREQIMLTYTIDQARAAGMIKPGSAWDKRPEEMLRKSCGVQLSRILFPGALEGLYAAEEMGAA